MLSTTTTKRLFSNNNFYGALPGGFSKESLQQWSIQTWKEEDNNKTNDSLQIDDPYVDLFSQSISTNSIEYLNNSKVFPSNQLLSCFFTSKYFLPERIILTPFLYNDTTVRTTGSNETTEFKMNDQYLAWKVKSHSPLEIICSWKITNTIKGFTMIAYDPQLRKVYHGNCMHVLDEVKISGLFLHVIIPLHVRYARLLLHGMVEEIEKKSTLK